jgi:hypothetical protein
MGNKAGAATLDNAHIHLPTKRDVRDWLKKTFTKGMKADAPLIAYCLFLLGCACFSLVRAFNDCPMAI